jgi:hypothetical protein
MLLFTFLFFTLCLLCMGKIYLLANDEWTQFKIGITKKSTSERIKNLQTGNGSKITIVKEYDTEHARKIESWLHGRYNSKRLVGEWFSLDDDDIMNFTETCKEIEVTIKFLIEHNPFYK